MNPEAPGTVRPRPAPTAATAFAGPRIVAFGPLADVAVAVRLQASSPDGPAVLIFDDATGRPVDIDYRGSDADIRARIAAQGGIADSGPPDSGARPASGASQDTGAPRGPGRPRLGVVAREVTLLPRHWEWLSAQPGGASVALRRLVDEARKAGAGRDRMRAAQEAAYRFLSAMAGNEPGFEEATRALFAADRSRFDNLAAGWPPDVAAYARRLAEAAFATDAA